MVTFQILKRQIRVHGMDQGRFFGRQLSRRLTIAAERSSAGAWNAYTKFIQHREVNLVLASIIIFISLYLTFVSVLRRPVMQPLVQEDDNSSFILYDEVPEDKNQTTLPEGVRYSNSAMSIFLLWLISNVVGSIFEVIQLPSLLGGIVTGIVCKNVPQIDDILYIEPGWSQFFRKAALTVVLIRAGIGLNPSALKKTKGAVLKLGLLATLCEAASIVLMAHFVVGMAFSMSLLFGIILAATSPAVTVPAMLDLMRHGYGTASKVPSALIASCAIDNMTCIVGFNVFVALVFSKVELKYEFTMIFTTIIIGAVVGIVFGRILWVFPYERSRHVHSIRWALSLSVCLALNFGTLALDISSAGVIGTILLNMVASLKWKKYYKEKPYKESETFALMWNFFAMQIMFSLIGYEFDFKKIYPSVVLKAIMLLGTGAAVRIVVVFLLSFGSGYRISEQVLMSLAFFSKATLQAALSPQVVDRTQGTDQVDEAHFLLSTCVIGIIIMAPIGQFILQILGPIILSPKNVQNIEVKTPSVMRMNSEHDSENSERSTVPMRDTLTISDEKEEDGSL